LYNRAIVFTEGFPPPPFKQAKQKGLDSTRFYGMMYICSSIKHVHGMAEKNERSTSNVDGPVKSREMGDKVKSFKFKARKS
jgi:hypothetical protein